MILQIDVPSTEANPKEERDKQSKQWKQGERATVQRGKAYKKIGFLRRGGVVTAERGAFRRDCRGNLSGGPRTAGSRQI
jgi:hypothetical protein|uniref:Uncharacterized protein n=1 Tax=Oryza sativa subsp. japonica TaxID=39947 RepID=Q6H4F3_ORYSJ|nr:hypothetical protein [Oryza sativa Japonica Group]